MARDPSYAEYVDARWFVLYRLAVLLVGEERAGRVTEAALVRAYLHWRDAEEAASTDAHVEGLLARTAVEEVVTRSGERHGLEALPTRQRAVVVLRCFELLDAGEIARALGGELADVEAEWSAALAASGLSEHELTQELERRAGGTTVPPAPVDRLVARARVQQRRERRRSLGRAARIVAAVVVVLAGATLLQDLTRRSESVPHQPLPADLSRLPLGVPPHTAYSEGLTLYLRGGPLILQQQPLALEQAGRWVYLTYASGRVDRVDDRTLETTTLTERATGRVVADPTGRYVAWVGSAPDAARPVVVVRVVGSRGQTVRQQQRQFPAGTDPFVLVGLGGNGDVFASRPTERDGAWVWRSRLIPAPGLRDFDQIVGGGNGTLAQVVSGDLVVDTQGSFDVGTLEGANLVFRQEVWAVLADFADPEARRVAYVDDGRLLVADRKEATIGRRWPPAHELRLRVPGHAAIADLRWEDAGHVLVDVTDPTAPNGALARCDVHTGSCELAARFDGPHLLAH